MKLNELKYVEERFPYFISMNYKKIFSNQIAEERLKIVLHTYDLLLRTLTIGVLSQYWGQDKDKVSDPFLNDLLIQKLPQLTLDAWQKILFASLETYRNHKELLFMPEVYDLYWKKNSDGIDDFHSDFEEPFRRLTQISAEVTVDELRPKSEKEWQELCDESSQLLADIFDQVKFLASYQLIRVTNKEAQKYLVEQYQGQTITLKEYNIAELGDLQIGWFYWRDRLGNIQILHPLFVFWEEPIGVKDIAVYDRFIVKRMQYLLALLGTTILGSGSVEEFVNLIFKTLEDAKDKKNLREKFTWESLRGKSLDISKLKMATVQYKYRPHLYLQRDKAREAFDGFLKSDKKCFVLIGKSGVGKSNFLLALADELRDQLNTSLLMYDGAQLRVEPSVTETINQDFKTRLNLGEAQFNIWQEINKLDMDQDRKVILLVDAINENPDSKQLLRQLDELAASPWPWLKIVFTSRPETWYVIRRGVKLAEALYYQERETGTIGVELEPFSYSEELQPFTRQELPAVYEKHKKSFGLSTSYEELSSELKDSIQDPLNLWLVANIYQNGAIPPTLHSTKLIGDYIGALLKSARISSIDLNFLEKKLVPLMSRDNEFKNSISMEDMDEAGSSLFEAVYSEQILRDGRRMNQSFTNLVDADILVRQDEGRNQRIAFKYERFYEYFFGVRLFELAKTPSERVLYYRKVIELTLRFPFLWGAIKIALVNEVKNHGEKIVVELCFTDDQKTKELMVVALTEAGIETNVDTILDGILNSRGGKRVFKRLIKRKWSEQSFINAQKIVVEVASNLGIISVLADIAKTASPKLRAHAVKYSYYLWSRNQEKGYLLLDELSRATLNRFNLPNIKTLDFCINLVLLIFFDYYESPVIKKRLQEVLHRVLSNVLYVNTLPASFTQFENTIRELLLQGTVSLVVNITSKNTRYFPPNLREVDCFFHLSNVDKQQVLKLMEYLDPKQGDFDTIADIVTKVAETDDAFSTYIMLQVIITQAEKYGTGLVPILEKIYYGGMVRGGSSAATQAMFVIYWSYLYNEELCQKNQEIVSLLCKMEEEFMARTKGVHFYRSKYEYAYLCIWATLAYQSDMENRPLYKYVQRALLDRDSQFALDLIWALEVLAITYKQSLLSLSICEPLLKFDDKSVQKAVVAYLARLKQYYPEMVDNFLADHELDTSFVQRVNVSETSEQENDIFGKAGPFMYRELPRSPYLRKEAAKLYRNISNANNIRNGIIAVLKKLISVSYGLNIFSNKLGDE